MILKVNKDICEIKQNEVWNVGDYNVHVVQVELSEEFDGLVNKVRYFVEDNSYDMLITDNVAQVPYEATLTEGTIKIGVYGYDADTNILVQSTSPVNKYISSGTYTGEANNTEPLTPTDKEQMESAIQKNTNDITDLKANKQDKLISGVNIKTINNESILSGGNLTLVEEETDPIFTNSPAYSITDNDITYWNNKANMSDIPDVSNFITKDVDDLTYYTKSTDMQTAINNAVGNERTARENADNSLQNQIDAITVSSDVVDVVSTYQDLVDYDTQHIKANDIIKVMQDSTHDNAISYYRWVIVNHVGSWEYVGSEGPYYTKSETDTLLNAKQNTLFSGQNIKTINNESLLGEGNINIQSGGTSDYEDLENLPKVNNVELKGNKTLNDLGIQPVGNYALESEMIEAQNDIDHLSTVTNLFEKITRTGTSVTLNDTSNTIMKLNLDTTTSSQEETPSPSDPQEIHTITGNNVITISNSDNTKSQTYPINLGDIAICKIGDYQDILFKNTINSEYYDSSLELNKWYLKKNVGKVVLDGSENWVLHSSSGDSYRYWLKNTTSSNAFTDIFTNIISGGEATLVGKLLCNYFTQKLFERTYIGTFSINVGNNENKWFLANVSETSLENFKTWLSTHNTIVYYPLATPQDILLNDTLQTQLNNIQYALAYDTQTNISQTNTDLPFIINAETYVDLTDYVKNTDYASSSTGGVIKTNPVYGSDVSAYGTLKGVALTYSNYGSSSNDLIISKGTLENVITGKNLETDNNKVTSVSSSSTDVQYPSAKCVYTNVLQLYNTKAEVINNTATGSIAHIEDGANNYSINNLITDINHIQNLHGYNSPWVGGEGKNLLDPSKVSTITAYGLTITFSNNVFSISGTPTTQSASLSFNIIDYSDYSLSGKNFVIQALEISGTPIKSIYGFRTEQEKRVAIVFDSVANPTINTTFKLSVSPTSQTVWSPYENICPITGWTGATISQSGEDTSNPTTRNISWQSEAGIIYGGTLDVISGVLTVTDQNIASYNGENLPSTWISDRDVYSVGETPTIGAQVVYKLATPATYQLPPQEIKTVLGINNIWSNTGNTTVNYKADTKLYIDNKFQSLEDRLSLLEG